MGPIRIAIAGDVMLGRLLNPAMQEHGPAAPWQAVHHLWDDADLFLYNLECAICDDTPPPEPEKTFHFRMDPMHLEAIKQSRVDAVTLANNHTLDHGIEGLQETLDHLETIGVRHAGAGTDAKAARAPTIIQTDTDKIALISAADHPRHWAATEHEPGTFIIDPNEKKSLQNVKQSIHQARQEGADPVIVGLHWGPNMTRRPRTMHPWFARRLIDAGASIVWGTSAHLFQGIEFYHNGVILYDTGDFLDDYRIDPYERNDLTFLFTVELSDNAVREVRLDSVRIENRRTVPAARSEARFMGRLMQRLSAPYGTLIEPSGEGFTAVPVQKG